MTGTRLREMAESDVEGRLKCGHRDPVDCSEATIRNAIQEVAQWAGMLRGDENLRMEILREFLYRRGRETGGEG